ncbi:terminase gpA endonuclease subunit [Escherichia coli]|uniref:terminase gpA endonuclease subunit n=1 Tax=Escherichia coli TaxID=562 RepID=UPI00388E82A6
MRTWEAEIGERPDAEVMAERKSIIQRPFLTVWHLTAGIDSQLIASYEMRVWGWGAG